MKKDGRVGFTVIGYGSCGGCDDLEALKDSYNLEPYTDEDDDNNDEYSHQDELEDYQNALQSYADELENNVHYGSYEELKDRITGADNRIKWYSKDAGFNASRKALLESLRAAFS